MTEAKEAKYTISKLQRFLQFVPWLILLLTLAVSSLTIYQSLQVKEGLFHAWVTELSYKKRIEFKRFVEPVVTSLRIAGEWVGEVGLDLEKRAEINRYFIPTLKNISQIHALIIANSKGQEYFLQRIDNGWQSRSSDPVRWSGKVLQHRWHDGNPVGEGSFKKSGYDPRQRPWFKGALKADSTQEIFWTPPYRFFSDGQVGITASLHIPATESGPREESVVAFDVLLSDLLAWTSELELGAQGRAFMISDDGRVLGVSGNQPQKANGTLPEVETLADESFGPALAKWQRSPTKAEQVFSFQVAGKPWWAGFAALKIGDRHLWFAVVLPEKDIEQIADYPVSFFMIPLIIFGVGSLLFFLSLFFVRRYLYSLEALRIENRRLVEDELQREAVLDDPAQRIFELIKAGESERLEFKSTVRWNLREDRAGKEIEIAWLKGVVGFLNTEGGVLLIGVEDDGKVAGLERDNFANDDKCLRHIDSLISTHIGLEFSRFIHFAMVEIGDQKIVEIRCQLSEIPAFLKKGEAEEFFIRTGPASRKLKPSQIIKYLAGHKVEATATNSVE